MCTLRGRGRLSRTVARSLAREDCTTTRTPRVGELQPELYFLGVGGQFHDLVKRTKNRLRASRACSGGAPGRAQPVGNAQRARLVASPASHGALEGGGLIVHTIVSQ